MVRVGQVGGRRNGFVGGGKGFRALAEKWCAKCDLMGEKESRGKTGRGKGKRRGRLKTSGSSGEPRGRGKRSEWGTTNSAWIKAQEGVHQGVGSSVMSAWTSVR